MDENGTAKGAKDAKREMDDIAFAATDGVQDLAPFAPLAVNSPEPVAVHESGILLFPEESYKIMGACFAVYKELGCGFLEAVYQEALSIEFAERGIPYAARKPLSLTYRSQTLKQGYACDFLLFNNIILEIKAQTCLCDENFAQTMNYLKASRLTLGLLVNFGAYPVLDYRRIGCTDGRYAR